jgi:phosphatidylglycerophosphatase A
MILETRHKASGPATHNDWLSRVAVVLATGFGIGFVRIAPGTFGSLLGLPLAWLIQQLPAWAQWGAPAILFVIGAPLCGRAALRLRKKDPGEIVLDEIAAFSVVFLFIPFSLASAIGGFSIFRLFDITKPWPARRLEMLPGGWGIMADDYAAAVYSAGLMWLIARWWPLG